MKLYTMRDKSTGKVSREDKNLSLSAVMKMTDWTDTDIDMVANMPEGMALSFYGGIEVECQKPAGSIAIEDHIADILNHIEGGSNGMMLRPGLIETPKRVAKAYAHWFGGYAVDIPALFKTFEDGAEGTDQMVTVCNIPFYSKCEHHMADIFGHATIAYIPNGKIVGLSKLNRVVDAFARRLQVQERLTTQIADAIQEHLDPVGVGVYVTARHMCVESRGIMHHCTNTVTTALRGAIRDEDAARAEFLQFARDNTQRRA